MSEYTLLWPIGRGGMATVWEARYKLPGGSTLPVACKIVHDHIRESEDGDKLFEREAEINLRLAARHPGIVPARNWFEVDGKLCLVMDLIEGCSLDKLEDVRLPYTVLRRVAIQTLDAIAYLHERDILHRDVSPSNILLSTHGEVLITDFGLSKRLAGESTQTSNFRGKYAYAAPEVMRGEAFDIRADLYSFGAMLYEILSGEPPTGDALGFAAIMRHHAEGTARPLPDDLPADLRTLAMGLIAKDPADRVPQTAADARDQLEADSIGYPGDLARLVAPVYERERARLRKSHAHDKTTRRIVVTDALSASPEAGQLDTVKHPRDDDRDDRDTQTAPRRLLSLPNQPTANPDAPATEPDEPTADPPQPRRTRRLHFPTLALVAVAIAAATLGYLASGRHDPLPTAANSNPPASQEPESPEPNIIADVADAAPASAAPPPTQRTHPIQQPLNGPVRFLFGDE